MIPVRNIYYMLAYAFRALRMGGFERLEDEDFDNSLELCAAILELAVEQRLKQGVRHDYLERSEELSLLRGRIDVAESITSGASLRRRLVCTYDDYSEDCTENRVAKATMSLLCRSDCVCGGRKRRLRMLLRYFAGVTDINVRKIDWRIVDERADHMSRLILFVCRLAIEGLLQVRSSDGRNVRSVLDDQTMHRLYEKFILGYYRAEHREVSAHASQVPWCVDSGAPTLLPIMRTDVMLRADDRVLIIDAKYYEHSTQGNFNVRKFHSSNLYQIFSYVKNEQLALPAGAPPVAGMLLYAKTDEDVVPDARFTLSGNPMAVDTLDLSQPFEGIRAQLDAVVEEFFS